MKKTVYVNTERPHKKSADYWRTSCFKLKKENEALFKRVKELEDFKGGA